MMGGKQNAPHSILTKQIRRSGRFSGDEDLLELISGSCVCLLLWCHYDCIPDRNNPWDNLFWLMITKSSSQWRLCNSVREESNSHHGGQEAERRNTESEQDKVALQECAHQGLLPLNRSHLPSVSLHQYHSSKNEHIQ